MASKKDDTGGRKSQKYSESNDNTMNENGIDEEPDFSDPEDYVDSISDEDLLSDILKKKPKEHDGIDSVVIVDNIPVVGTDRLEKLQNVLRKHFAIFGKIQTEHMPMKDGKTKGYMFLEYSNPREAGEAVKNMDGKKLDKHHTFKVNLFTDFDRYSNIPDQWETPEPQPYKDPGNLKYWLMEKNCFDQFSILYEGGQKAAIFLNSNPEPSVIEERANWTETYVKWSPSGNFLATFHKRGVALWGGEEFKQIMRFQHEGVQLIDFSPCERYLVTFSPLTDSRDEPKAVIIWEVMSGLKKRGFHCENASAWPIFKWSADGKYFARMGQDMLSVYETPSFGLLDKTSIKVERIRDFAWSPTDNVISYWTPETRDTPARVVLIKIPARETICQKNLFTVKECRLHWQKSGDYLCVKVDRYKGKKEEKDTVKYSGVFHNFALFRIREKGIPVDTIEQQEPIQAFAWEPIGNKFAFIHGEAPRICVSFYVIVKQGKVELLKTMDKKTCNHLFWSPNGQFIVLAGLRSQNGLLEFVDSNDMTIMTTAEHFMATDVEWDPTGRYVSTAVSWWAHKVDNAFWLWNFQGKLIYKQSMEKFCQLLWRPRPLTLLSKEKIKEIKKTMKKYSQRFSVDDKMRESKASKEQIEQRRTLMAEFEVWAEALKKRFREESRQRRAMRSDVDTDALESDVHNFEVETIEFLDRVEETIIEE